MPRPPVPFRARRSTNAAAVGDRIYFFGGVGANTGTESILDVSDELWCYEPADASWRRVPRTDPWPEPRRCSGFAAHGEAILLWGGSGVAGETYTFLDDFWRFQVRGERWELIEAHGSPPARYWPVFVGRSDDTALFGGYTEDAVDKRKLDDLWLRVESEWRAVDRPPRPHDWPSARYGAAGASLDGDVVACFGFGDEDHNDVWLLRGESWEAISPDRRDSDAPPPRYCAAVAVHERMLVVFGGRSRSRPKDDFDDLWILDLDSGAWSLVAPGGGPQRYDGTTSAPAYHAKAATACHGGFMYLWGGEGLRGHVSDFWRLDLATLQWEPLQPARDDDPILW